MLKQLFTSNTRVKLLTLFLMNMETEFFIRELTRKLDEQINSIRRELDNLEDFGLLKAKVRNRKKYYLVDKNFIALHELRSIIMKLQGDKETLAKRIAKYGDIDLLVLAGEFVEKPDAEVDLLVVGQVDKPKLEDFLNNEIETRRPVKFAIMSKDDFLYRLKCKDKFVQDILKDKENIVAVNRIETV